MKLPEFIDRMYRDCNYYPWWRRLLKAIEVMLMRITQPQWWVGGPVERRPSAWDCGAEDKRE